MIISSGNFALSYQKKLSNAQSELLSNDPNCLRSTMGKPWNEVITEHTTWIVVHGKVTGDFIGAFFLDEVEINSGAVCMHIMLRENYARETALTLTKLASFYARILGMIPYTTVSTDPKYDYMRKFLADCGFVHHMYKEDIEIITIPTHYIPNLPLITLHQ